MPDRGTIQWKVHRKGLTVHDALEFDGGGGYFNRQAFTANNTRAASATSVTASRRAAA